MKMLGFVFGRRPNAEANTAYIRKKFYGKQWILRHLKKAGVDQKRLVEVYKCYIRPVIECSSNVYHALLTEEMTKEIENMQRSALRLIFGNSISYRKCLEKADVPTLQERREKAFRSFAMKNQNHPRLAQKWFAKRHTTQTRQQEKYAVTNAKYDRLENGPLNQMRKLLNQL